MILHSIKAIWLSHLFDLVTLGFSVLGAVQNKFGSKQGRALFVKQHKSIVELVQIINREFGIELIPLMASLFALNVNVLYGMCLSFRDGNYNVFTFFVLPEALSNLLAISIICDSATFITSKVNRL
jgi:hypothetical protein